METLTPCVLLWVLSRHPHAVLGGGLLRDRNAENGIACALDCKRAFSYEKHRGTMSTGIKPFSSNNCESSMVHVGGGV